jgi:MFS family permease
MKTSFNFKVIAPCLFAVLVDILGFSLALPVLTALFTTGDFFSSTTPDKLRYAYLAIGLVLYPFFMFFGSSFMGDLSDITGRKKVLMMCMGGFCVGFALMGVGTQLQSLSLLFVGRALTGITAASLPTTMAAIADLSTRENKAIHMSFVVLVQSIGFVLGPLIGGLLSDPKVFGFFSDAFPFYVAGILALFAFAWLGFAFHESFVPSDKKIHPLRVILVFVEAAKHPPIRNLTFVFLLHQLGIGLFIQLILIYFQRSFDYTTFGMGIFNSFMGVWLGLGLFLIPTLSKRFRIEKVVWISLFILGISQLVLSASSLQWLLWLLVIPLAASANIAWSAILTSFSHAVSEDQQGWALGITGAVVALAFIITGFSPNLVPHFGVMPLIAAGGVLVVFSSIVMQYYCKQYVK